MRLYLAGLYSANISLESNFYRRSTEVEKAARRNVKHLLESYHYINRQGSVDKIRRDKTKVFLDSGAFSAFSLGVEIDLAAYCDYCLRNQDIIEVVSVLDGIGDPLKTWQNQQAMEARGVRPLPCFHYGEDEEYLKWYLANYDHITLGGMVPISKPQLIHWLDRMWTQYLTKPDGTARVKVHGFGLTQVPLIERYPWYSVDSSSWVWNAANGAIMIPELGNVFISTACSQRKIEGRHYFTLSKLEQDAVRHAVERRGFDFERMLALYIGRYTFNMLTFTELNDIPCKFTPKPGFF
jgi:hypothetical protein